MRFPRIVVSDSEIGAALTSGLAPRPKVWGLPAWEPGASAEALASLARAAMGRCGLHWQVLRAALVAFLGEAVLMMELPKRYSTPSEGGRFAPIKSSDYGGRPFTGPRPDDLSELRLVEWSGWVNE